MLGNRYNIPYFESSAKMGINVDESVMRLATDVVESGVPEEMSENLRLSYMGSKSPKKRTCCKN
jgi:hypothetical protein